MFFITNVQPASIHSKTDPVPSPFAPFQRCVFDCYNDTENVTFIRSNMDGLTSEIQLYTSHTNRYYSKINGLLTDISPALMYNSASQYVAGIKDYNESGWSTWLKQIPRN